VVRRLLDLFSGAGGAAVGYHRAGFEVSGVDVAPQPHYPYEFFQCDALELLKSRPMKAWLAEYDVLHASPPCQAFSAYRRRGDGVGANYPDLISEVRAALKALDLPYVIENIPRSPLHDPVTVCGSSFGLDLQRHRLFESNLPLVVPPCNHEWQTPRFAPAANRSNLRRTVEVGAGRSGPAAPDAMGIDWMTREELSEAVPPAYTEFLGRQIHAWLRARSPAAGRAGASAQ
jgi:DNA (cytosine-5)-methyltransferase 1